MKFEEEGSRACVGLVVVAHDGVAIDKHTCERGAVVSTHLFLFVASNLRRGGVVNVVFGSLIAMLRGLVLAFAGAGGSYFVGEKLDEAGYLRDPKLAKSMMMVVSLGFIPVGAGVSFFHMCRRSLVDSRLLREIVEINWKNKTTWAGKNWVTGDEIELIVKSLTEAKTLGRLFDNRSALPIGLRLPLTLISKQGIENSLRVEMEPFFKSQKVVADRLTLVLGETVEKYAAQNIRLAEEGFVVGSFAFLGGAYAWIFCLDRFYTNSDNLVDDQAGENKD